MDRICPAKRGFKIETKLFKQFPAERTHLDKRKVPQPTDARTPVRNPAVDSSHRENDESGKSEHKRLPPDHEQLVIMNEYH